MDDFQKTLRNLMKEIDLIFLWIWKCPGAATGEFAAICDCPLCASDPYGEGYTTVEIN